MIHTPLREMAETIVKEQDCIDWVTLYSEHPHCNWRKVHGACQQLLKGELPVSALKPKQVMVAKLFETVTRQELVTD